MRWHVNQMKQFVLAAGQGEKYSTASKSLIAYPLLEC